jgi:hypothetical protein
MSVQGRWRIVGTPGYIAVPGAYIVFGHDSGDFAFDCLTGSIHGGCDEDTVEFDWDGNDQMEEPVGQGWAELQDDGSLEGEICPENGDDMPFMVRRSITSSTACSS